MSVNAMDPTFMRAYQEADRDLRVRFSKVGALLCIVLVTAGSSLEYLVYPHLFWRILTVRLLCNVLTAGLFGLHFTDLGRRHIRILGMSWIMLVPFAISWMIYISEGAISPYYAGLNLVIVAAAVILPWTFWETLFICTFTLATYLAACLFHEGTPIRWGIFGNNLFFLVATAIICVTTSHFTARNRFEDFRLRYELDIRNKELAQSYNRLSELDRLKSEFVANLSHELRTPMTLIISPIDDLLRRETDLPDKVREPLTIARDNSLRLLKLMNDLLEITRLEEGGLDVRDQPIDLSSFVPGMVDSLRHLADVKGLALEVHGEDQPVIVQWDPSHLEKVLLNLLTNAVKFTPAGGTITTRWWREGSLAIAEVEDTGVGIAEEDIPFIFDRFRQVDGSSTRRHQGVGIGLALARELVGKHGGTLSARSEPGKGTTLRMELPVSDKPAEAAASQRTQAPEVDRIAEVYRSAERTLPLELGEALDEARAVGSGDFSVLVVDDEPDMRRFLVNLLAEDHRVLQAADGETALSMTREHMPDLVLLDLMLPGIDGLDVCQAIKDDEATRSVKVVLLTARADEQSKIEALERRADDFLVKPFSTIEVKTRLANLLRAAKLEQDVRNRNVELADALARLKDTEAQLVQSEKISALGSLAAGLLHEINNPLNFMLTAVQVARDASHDSHGDLKQTLDDMEEGMLRIRDIISDLRAFAHPPQEGDQMPFEFGGVLDTALRLTAHELNGLNVVRDIPTECAVLGSRTQIAHVLMNLLTNSAKAFRSVPEGRRLEIRVSARRDNGRLRVQVRDNGEGVTPANLSKVFDPFFTTRGVGEGLGLGLSICHTIVKNHGGMISIRSEEGEWTEITFDLELANGEA